MIDKIGQDLFVLGEEGLHIHHEVLDYGKCRERLQGDGFREILHECLARQTVSPVNLHGTGPAYAVATGLSECKASIQSVLYLHKAVKQSLIRFHMQDEFFPSESFVLPGIESSDPECILSHGLPP